MMGHEETIKRDTCLRTKAKSIKGDMAGWWRCHKGNPQTEPLWRPMRYAREEHVTRCFNESRGRDSLHSLRCVRSEQRVGGGEGVTDANTSKWLMLCCARGVSRYCMLHMLLFGCLFLLFSFVCVFCVRFNTVCVWRLCALLYTTVLVCYYMSEAVKCFC